MSPADRRALVNTTGTGAPFAIRLIRAVEHDLGYHSTDTYRGLAEHVTAVESYTLGPEWRIHAGATPRGVWRVCTRCKRIDVGDPGEVALARYTAAQRETARAHLARTVRATRVAVGLDRPRLVQAPKCQGCQTRPSPAHVPYSSECLDAHAERALSIADR